MDGLDFNLDFFAGQSGETDSLGSSTVGLLDNLSPVSDLLGETKKKSPGNATRKRCQGCLNKHTIPFNFVRNRSKPNTPRRRPPGGDFRRTKPSDQKCSRCTSITGSKRFKRTALNFGGCFCVHACGGGRNGDPHMHHPPQNRSCSRLMIPDCMRCPCKDKVMTRFEPAPGLPGNVLDDMWVCKKHTVPNVYSLDVYQECDRIVRKNGGCGKDSIGFHMLSCASCESVLQQALEAEIAKKTGCTPDEAKKIAQPLQRHHPSVQNRPKPKKRKRRSVAPLPWTTDALSGKALTDLQISHNAMMSAIQHYMDMYQAYQNDQEPPLVSGIIQV